MMTYQHDVYGSWFLWPGNMWRIPKGARMHIGQLKTVHTGELEVNERG
jgi:hypothetical protein